MIFIVYNKRTSSHYVSSVPHFSLSTSDLFSLLALVQTTGTSGILSTLCPLAINKEGIALAANAEHTAYLLCFWLMGRCHLLQVLVGANIRPPLHMLPKAA